MAARRVIIADPNEEFRLSLAQALSQDFLVTCCSDGQQALELVRAQSPHILVTELILENMDGISLLQKISCLPVKPRIMVISNMITEYVKLSFLELGIQYAMVKPCIVSVAAQRIRELADSLCLVQEPPVLYGQYAASFLMELQIPNGRQGFGMLRTALGLLMVCRDRRLSKELYEDVARLHSSKAANVEKAIRDVLRDSWSLSGSQVWGMYFPDTAHPPSNGEFLFRAADILSERLRKDTAIT